MCWDTSKTTCGVSMFTSVTVSSIFARRQHRINGTTFIAAKIPPISRSHSIPRSRWPKGEHATHRTKVPLQDWPSNIHSRGKLHCRNVDQRHASTLRCEGICYTSREVHKYQIGAFLQILAVVYSARSNHKADHCSSVTQQGPSCTGEGSPHESIWTSEDRDSQMRPIWSLYERHPSVSSIQKSCPELVL